MTLTLPLELQLHILELAVPPFTRKHLAEHRELMRTWTLVCRDWRDAAPKIVATVPKLDFNDPRWETLCHLEDQLASATAGGRTVTRLEVQLDELGDRSWPGNFFESVYHADRTRDNLRIEELWITAPRVAELKLEKFANLRRLNLENRHRNEYPLVLHNLSDLLPASLVSLRLRNIEAQVCPLGLHTLILDHCDWNTSIYDSLPNLRLLAVRQLCSYVTPDDMLVYLKQAPSTLEHAYFPYSTPWEDGYWDPVELRPLTLPAALKSLTFRYTSTPIPDEYWAPLHATCEAHAVRLAEVVCSEEDVEDWKAEEWAWSLGG
ncbi:hypothetical protein JCM10450v2_007490 [Rhodotorula kratochvilovae]